MKKPDIPSDEKTRLGTLRALHILDTSPEERFDRITRIAKRLFAIPIALVSLIDENRQWFKSCVGVSVTETPRDISFCGHAILDDDVFVIPDAREDARFADNPLVVDFPYIRFYAGCPLKAANGSRLGTLCLIDPNPRQFDATDTETLQDLAAMVEYEIAAVQLATLDELTGISNRRGFAVLAQRSLHFCVQHKYPAALVFLDLDKFKPINDKFGHVEGDRALVGFAQKMRESFRESDVFARLSGDEFVVLFSNTSKEIAETYIAAFHNSLSVYN